MIARGSRRGDDASPDISNLIHKEKRKRYCNPYLRRQAHPEVQD